jgi:hypothetical protein
LDYTQECMVLCQCVAEGTSRKAGSVVAGPCSTLRVASLGCALLLCAAARPAAGLDETGDMLLRIRQGLPPTSGDQRLARELLADWVDCHPDDAYLRAAFRRISQGQPVGAEEKPAVLRLHNRYTVARARAMARARGERAGAPPPGSRPVERSAGRSWSALGESAVVVAMTVVVLVVGAGWILWSRRGAK